VAVLQYERKMQRRFAMSLGTILLIVLILALVGVLPTWSHSSSWGYAPTGGVGLILVIVLILVLLGKL
jgi:drug/metabolite transporter superfamily protein YnfA